MKKSLMYLGVVFKTDLDNDDLLAPGELREFLQQTSRLANTNPPESDKEMARVLRRRDCGRLKSGSGQKRGTIEF